MGVPALLGIGVGQSIASQASVTVKPFWMAVLTASDPAFHNPGLLLEIILCADVPVPGDNVIDIQRFDFFQRGQPLFGNGDVQPGFGPVEQGCLWKTPPFPRGYKTPIPPGE